MFIHLLQLGRISYAEGLEVQRRVVEARKQGRIGDTLLLLEHPAVITLGRNASRSNVLASDEWLAARGVELHEVNRGGDVTYHGPGQLVGYPIVDLRGEWPGKKGPFLGPVDFVRLLEEALIRVCGEFGVMAGRVPKCTGVWSTSYRSRHAARVSAEAEEQMRGGMVREVGVEREGTAGPSTPLRSAQDDNSGVGGGGERKLAAIGVHVSQGVTSHGFALNVTPDLREFEWIVPCGIRDRGVTSLEAEASVEVTMEAAGNAVARAFGRVFGRQVVAVGSVEELLGGIGPRG